MSKSMIELFNPLTITLELKAERPYFEIDGARTYILTDAGELSQNAVEALLKFKTEKAKYEKHFDKMRDFLVDVLVAGSTPQKGNREVALAKKVTTGRAHKTVLEVFALKVFKGDAAKVKLLMDQATPSSEKDAIKVDGVFV